MNAELTAENRPACVPPGSVFGADCGNKTTDEDEGRVQVLVVLFRVISVKLSRLSAVDSEKVGSGIVGPQWFEEVFEGGMEAGFGCQLRLAVTAIERTGRTISDLSVRPLALVVEGFLAWSPSEVVVGRGYQPQVFSNRFSSEVGVYLFLPWE